MIGDAAVEGRQPGDAAKPQALALEVDDDADCRPARDRSARRRGPARSSPGRHATATRRPSCSSVKPISGRAIASRRTTSRQAAYSDARRAQELAPRRHAREQRLDPHPRAGRQRRRPFARPARHCRRSAPSPPRRAPGFRASAARRWRSRAAPRRENPASRRFDRVIGQLRGRVPLQRQRHFVGRHAAAVVGHLDQVDAARRQANRRSASRRRRSRFRPVPSARWRVVRPLRRRRCD